MANVTVSIYSPNTFDNILLTENSSFTAAQKEKLLSTSQEDGYYNLQWEDFDHYNGKEVLVLCNYLSDINSTSSPLGVLKGYEVQKREYGDNYWSTVYRNDSLITGGNSNPVSYTLYDYNIKNNTYYYYRVIPLTLANNISGAGLYSDEQCILTGWETFSLMPLIITPDAYNMNTKIAQPLIIDGQPQIWNFSVNCEEGTLTKTQDKTYFQNFTKYPKVNIGQTSYYTIPFSALLGTIQEDLSYYEPNNMLEQWNKFLDGGYICLYKNLKGDAKIVSIDPDPSTTYANNYNYVVEDTVNVGGLPANFTPNHITNRPTTISINLTEIDDATKYRIIRLE